MSDFWSPIVTDLRTTAVVEDIVRRLHTRSYIENSLKLSREESQMTGYVSWQNYAVAEGYAGLALLDAYLHDCFPQGGWDSQGHRYLVMASEIDSISYHLSLFSGLCGVAFTAHLLSADGARYQNLLNSLDSHILSQTRHILGEMGRQGRGFGVSQFDVVSGLAGIGAYLLCRCDQNEMKQVLHELAHQLIMMSAAENGVPHWYTPPSLIMPLDLSASRPGGLLNSGLAHGIAGPLALLSLIALHNENIEGLELGIVRMADWLTTHQVPDEWGINWGTVYPVNSSDPSPQPARTAWCYGAPGIARALWLAGKAVNRVSYQETAIAAMRAVYSKPVTARGILAPGFCHGTAGLLQITLRFAMDTHLSLFIDAAHALREQLVSQYEPESLLGYRDYERSTRLDRADVLNGTAGIALVLLAASQSQEPIWDRLFLLA